MFGLTPLLIGWGEQCCDGNEIGLSASPRPSALTVINWWCGDVEEWRQALGLLMKAELDLVSLFPGFATYPSVCLVLHCPGRPQANEAACLGL